MADIAVTPSEIEGILEECYKLRSEIVPCFIGAPGIGKTQGIYDFARKHNVKVVEIIASQILPNEVSGITMPVTETGKMDVFDHARLSALEDGDILFFDELLQAQTSTLNACLTLVQERRMMSGRMLPDVMIVGATNPVANTSSIPLSVRQRFMWVEVRFDSKEWAAYVRRNLGIYVTDGLRRMLSTEDCGERNVLTPRTATKLLRWWRESGQSGPARRMVEAMFVSGKLLLKELDGSISKRSPNRMLADYLSNEVMPTARANDVPDEQLAELRKFIGNPDDYSVEDMFALVTSLPNADSVMEDLKGIELA